jgi:bifunctional UDP-N-acetylglucosamine pyrophosphorylase/glucosamine-1-phosphate N-acetyltransferase
MKCVILAAGEGRRMHPLTFTRPKVMLPIANKPILEWNLLSAREAGLEDFIMVIGYKSEMVRKYFENGKKWGVSIEYINQGKALGTAHATMMVEKFVEDFIVLCGDTIFGEHDIKDCVNKEMSMGLVKVENPSAYGSVKTEGKKIIRIFEKVERPISNIINAGIYHFNRRIFDFIKRTPKSLRGEYEITDSINLLLEHEEMQGFFLKEWKDVVYPWHLLDANEEILKKVKGEIKGEVERNATLEGHITIGKNTKILAGSYIKGPVVIGDNCRIGPNCFIRPCTSIGNNCHIGNASEVKNSIVMDNSNIPHQNYVGDSIIGYNCNLGAGSKVANLRFDKKNIEVVLDGEKIRTGKRKLGVVMGDNVQTGINSVINVGSIIGNNVYLGPGAILSGEVKPGSRIL